MRKLNRVLLGLAVWLVCAPRYVAGADTQKAEGEEFEQQSSVSENKPLPTIIKTFQKLSFDERMEHREYLCQKYHANLFIDVLRYHILGKDVMLWDNRLLRSVEMSYLGREADTIPPGISMHEVMDLCGLKRLAALQKFKAKYPARSFLKGKDDFYRGGLNAEMEAFNEIGNRFDVEEWTAFRKMLREENQICSLGKDPSTGLVYQNEIVKRAQTRLQREQTGRYSMEL